MKLEFFAKCYIKTHQLDWMAMRLGNEIQTFVKQAMYYFLRPKKKYTFSLKINNFLAKKANLTK